MKIVHLIDYFQPRVGYQETFLAKEHKKLGHEVCVLTSNRYYPFPDYETTYEKLLGSRRLSAGRKDEEGIDTLRLESIEIPSTPLVYLIGLQMALTTLKPDVVFCHGVHSLTSYLIACEKKDLGFILIYDTHAAHFNTNLTNTFLKRVYHSVYQKIAVPKILKEKNVLFAIGEDEQSLLCEDFHLEKKDVPIIRLGVDCDRFKYSKAQRKRIRKKLQVSRDSILCIYTGKVTPNKDLDVLINAIQHINDARIKLLVVGNGDKNYINTLKKMIHNNWLIWVDFVDNQELFSYYSASDIAIWPGDSTIAIIEAISCKLPVILPIWYGTKYLDGSGGIFRFKRGNIDELVTQIRFLAYNNNLRKDVAKKVRRYVISELSWKVISQQTLQLL
ncbi:hypothetical protein A3D77_07335 [Candidatus Gottesmanbacteria bacterium RIFCSPHIGHO2_02_FULL_39_11]|uniref:Uncharacterized protein n=1 Tax=Candidatus Gottesmanbacteria bacterium RIFCSPHIGHO2_02_FULL_39_11 TaxID=1798382 RepID=A0A1F5ZKB4_9BACT|nr:MAG: hypothetical protein A3D77_07335 [Candidatus Gottesmanbacteria bacterium RIFCSPHIGHO2_02_FULL_39_11]